MTGFLVALLYVLRLEAAGLLWGGVPCSSYVWIARGHTERSRTNIMGNNHPAVLLGNCMTSRFCLLILIALARNVHWAIEQPGSSLMPYYPRLLAIMNSQYFKSYTTRL